MLRSHGLSLNILKFIEDNEEISIKDIETYFGENYKICKSDIEETIEYLVSKEQIEKGKNNKYRLKACEEDINEKVERILCETADKIDGVTLFAIQNNRNMSAEEIERQRVVRFMKAVLDVYLDSKEQGNK